MVTQDDILEMEAGRELDALVAEKVMGWQNIDIYAQIRTSSSVGAGIEPGNEFPTDLPFYSTSIADAWEIVKKLYLTVAPYSDNKWHAADGKVIAFASTASLAICRAALLTML